MKDNDWLEEDMSKLSDRQLTEKTLAELNEVNKNLVQIDKHLFWILPILVLITAVLISLT
jgi:hypothetical protein